MAERECEVTRRPRRPRAARRLPARPRLVPRAASRTRTRAAARLGTGPPGRAGPADGPPRAPRRPGHRTRRHRRRTPPPRHLVRDAQLHQLAPRPGISRRAGRPRPRTRRRVAHRRPRPARLPRLPAVPLRLPDPAARRLVSPRGAAPMPVHPGRHPPRRMRPAVDLLHLRTRRPQRDGNDPARRPSRIRPAYQPARPRPRPRHHRRHVPAPQDGDVVTVTDEDAVTLARETIALLAEAAALLRDLAARLEAAAEQADDKLAGGTAPKPVVYELIAATRLNAAAARGQAATP